MLKIAYVDFALNIPGIPHYIWSIYVLSDRRLAPLSEAVAVAHCSIRYQRENDHGVSWQCNRGAPVVRVGLRAMI